MTGEKAGGWARDARRLFARIPALHLGRMPEAPAHTLRDPWPGDPGRGARLLKGEVICEGNIYPLRMGAWGEVAAHENLRAFVHGFAWLRDLRALGTDPARLRARALVGDWIAAGALDPIAARPDVAGARLTSWLAQYDFFAASADELYRQRLMARLVSDARALAAELPAEQIDGRALTALKGLIAASVAVPDNAGFMTRAMRFLPQELARQILADGSQCERSPAAQLAALQDLIEMRALLQAAQAPPPVALNAAIERASLALRALCHGDGGPAHFNGGREGQTHLAGLALAQASRTGRAAASLPDGRFARLQAGKTLVLIDAGAPAEGGLDRFSHAGTLSFEMSAGRERLIVNCGAAPTSAGAWFDAMRATAAHSTLSIGDTSSSELLPQRLGRRPERVELQRQEHNGAYWLEMSQDGWRRVFNAVHHRSIYLSEGGDEVWGEDSVEANTPVGFTIRFHLHPGVSANLQQDGETALLRLPSGAGWRLRTEDARLTLEESVYFGGDEPRRCEQVVLTGYADGPQKVKWAIIKAG